MSVWLSNTPIYEESILRRYVVEKIAEPIAFNILREAQNVKSSNPRAALVLIAVALEVGAKVYISRKCPSCGRLMESMKSSPPMHSLINSFLATLDERLQLTRETKKMVVELFEDRNKLVHTGELFAMKSGDGVLDFSDATISRINNYFDLVKDLLYHFEISIGETWILFNTHIKDRRTIDV